MGQASVTVRNAMLDAIETTIGASGFLRMYTGAAPANTAAATSGTLLVDIPLPADWAAAASAGSKALLGSWVDSAADGTGTAGYYRIFASDGTTCHWQGSVSLTGAGGELQLQNTALVSGQGPITVTAFTWTAGNA